MWRQQIGERKSGQDISETIYDHRRLNPNLLWKNYPLLLSVYNEEKNIGRCIDSVKDIADEILILDSHSTDNTVAIAESKRCYRNNRRSFKGYIQKKNRAIELAGHNYILSLDADEALDPSLSDSISKVKRKFKILAYRMNRYSNYCGKFIRHGSWYPDTKIRLFDKRIAQMGWNQPS